MPLPRRWANTKFASACSGASNAVGAACATRDVAAAASSDSSALASRRPGWRPVRVQAMAARRGMPRI